MRNNEYREMLVAKKEKERDDWMVGHYDRLLSEYDRLHPETIQVLNVIVDGLPVVCLYDKVADCTIQLIDGTLNVEIQ